MAEACFGAFRKQIDSLVLKPSGGGVHEITVDGTLIHSKRQSGQQPDPAQIVAKIRALGAR